MSEIRRKLLMNVADKQEYIQDGLIMYLDCLDTANCANGYWHSDINNITFNGNAQYSERGFKFNGPNSGSYLMSSNSFVNSLNFKCSVEVVFESVNFTTWSYLFGDGDWSSKLISIVISEANHLSFTWRIPDSGTATNTTNGRSFNIPYSLQNTKCTLSSSFNGQNSNNKIGYLNSVQLTNSNTATGSTHRGRNMTIGNRNGGSGYKGTGTFSGYIKAVRYYNRALTAEEILHNQNIDNIRYNLGIIED